MTREQKALRDLQRAVRAYALGLGNEAEGWQRILVAESEARAAIADAEKQRASRAT